MSARSHLHLLVALTSSLLSGCTSARRPPEVVPPMTIASLPGHAITSEPQGGGAPPARLVPPEAYLRTYLQLFGGLSPAEVQRLAQGTQNQRLFGGWGEVLTTLGLPDYAHDFPRALQPNAVMVVTFDRMGIALCDRAAEHDLHGGGAALAERRIFAFELPPGDLDQAAFSTRFDVLHRTFLGYPARLAPEGRAARFFELYRATVARHRSAPPRAPLSAEETAWAVVCQALVRHPEFHFY